MITTSSASSEDQTGKGVPQNLLRLMAQSCAFSSQLWNRFSWTYVGTQDVLALLASSLSFKSSTLTNQLGTACGRQAHQLQQALDTHTTFSPWMVTWDAKPDKPQFQNEGRQQDQMVARSYMLTAVLVFS